MEEDGESQDRTGGDLMAYGEVQGKMWRSPSIRGLSDSQKLAWSYLLSNQHSNMLGYYLLPLPYMADDLEWPPERAVESIAALERRGLIAYDQAAQVVFVCKYLKYNCLSSGNRAVGALSRLENIPESPLSKRLFAAVSEWHPRLTEIRKHLGSGNCDTPLLSVLGESTKSQTSVFDESLVIDTVIAIDTEEVEDVFYTRKNRKITGRKLKWFEEFWDAFGYKKSKAAAGDSWLDIKGLNRALVDAIVAGAKKEAIYRKTLREDQTAKMAQGWLTDRRWEDEHVPSKNGDMNADRGFISRGSDYYEKAYQKEQERLKMAHDPNTYDQGRRGGSDED